MCRKKALKRNTAEEYGDLLPRIMEGVATVNRSHVLRVVKEIRADGAISPNGHLGQALWKQKADSNIHGPSLNIKEY